jgi:hypothetical protein
MHTLNTVSKLPMSTYIVATGKTHTPGNTVEIFRGTISEAISMAQESWPDADCHSVRDWLDILTSDYGSVEFEAQ